MSQKTYAEILLPLALGQSYTYEVPNDLVAQLEFGFRVEVPLNRKLYAGIVVDIHNRNQTLSNVKSIISIIDDKPILDVNQLKFWRWIAHYYCCKLGEVMNVALPSGLKLNSETKVSAIQGLDMHLENLEDDHFMVADALINNEHLGIDDIRIILGKKTVYPVIRDLLDQGHIEIAEELQTKYKERKAQFIQLMPAYQGKENELEIAFEKVKRSEKQTNALLAYLALSPKFEWVQKSKIIKKGGVEGAVIQAIVKKGIFQKEDRTISRIQNYEGAVKEPGQFSKAQAEVYHQCQLHFENNQTVLLLGVTGSGKTRVYIELIQETLAQEKQVLFLIPEIALTTQLVQRLQSIFGDKVSVYHSRLNAAQRVELYKSAQHEARIFVGARSSIFLPFFDLDLIIVDEEHDPSFKQNEPNPRYQGRDCALFLAQLHKANIILGTATPSLESYQNAISKKYGFLLMHERFGTSKLPKISLIDLRNKYKQGLMRDMFSNDLLEATKRVIGAGKQVLLFQNKRGFAPSIQCPLCAWTAGCPNCDVSLTTHRYFDQVNCHYCGFHQKTPKQCPQCGNTHLVELGFGTERIENVLTKLLPEARVQRMDFDTARTKSQYEKIISRFEEGYIDVLVGTQMITKGLDFANIALVGILLADKSLHFPDFRAGERAFQLFTQVAGRAGRRGQSAEVMIQTFNPVHPVLQETLKLQYEQFYKRELKERAMFRYPPFYRMIQITLKHKNFDKTKSVAQHLALVLQKKLGKRVIGPAVPGIGRLRGRYIQQILVKMEQDWKIVEQIKSIIHTEKDKIQGMKNMTTVQIIINVDP